MQRDSIQNTFIVATGVCVFWSVLVSTAAVVLRDRQEANKVEERRRNILMAAGLYDENVPLDELFKQVEAKIVKLPRADESEPLPDPSKYDQRTAAKDPKLSLEIERDDAPGIKRREKHSFVYLVRKKDSEELDQLVLPIYGKGLWSTLYGFVAVDATDKKTIRGLTFYEHAETPGLGGEIDNPSWKKKWEGKVAYDQKGVQIRVARGKAADGPEAMHEVDGLAGATLTANGVSKLVRYWLGDDGFGPFLKQLEES